MIQGIFRQGHPRVVLILPGQSEDLEVEFIVDTGFEGGLTLPMHLAQQLSARNAGFQNRIQADGSLLRFPCFEFFMEWDEEEDPQFVEVLVKESAPLIGTTFLMERLLQIEMTEGGEVTADPL
jgi:clan AA aspartic protease